MCLYKGLSLEVLTIGELLKHGDFLPASVLSCPEFPRHTIAIKCVGFHSS